MKFNHFHHAAALAFNLSLVTAIDGKIGKQKFLRDRNLEGGVDPALNKFIVDPNPSTSLFDESDVIAPEVVDGNEVDPRRKYGFFVSIGGCGASLVAPNVILSAAHCASITGPAVLGLHMKNVDGAEEFEKIEIIDFANSVTHPQYNSNTLNNDYWVIQLAHDTQLYQDQIVELDSPTDGFDLASGQDVTVVGMGATFSGGQTSDVLQEVTVDYITNAECCSSATQYECGDITENMMCAARAGKDSCQGDSGGPIFDTATQRQVGIVSWGYGCADATAPGVYSRVSAKFDWIKAQIDNFTSGGSNPPPPKVDGTCYDSPEFWYDSRGPSYQCGSSSFSCSNSNANGGITSNMACCACGGGEIYGGPPQNDQCVNVRIRTDNYPGETTWALTNNCNGAEVATGGPYSSQGTLYSERICLPDAAELSFQISDTWGDGICCGYGQGSYDVTYYGQNVASGGAFGSSKVTTFGVCSGPQQLVAEYNALLGVPKCEAIGSSCTSGELLDGKENNIEPNPPNTLDSCSDGPNGSYHGDESIDAITVSSVGGGQLEAGGLAEIEAKVWAWSDGAFDTADFYYTENVDATTWTLIGSLPAGGSGLRSLKIQYFLPESSIQAVRVNFRYGGGQSSCTGGNWDDVDDLVFTVAPAAQGAKETRKPEPVPELKPKQSTHCAMIGDQDRCDDVSVCKWQSGNGNENGNGNGNGKGNGNRNSNGNGGGQGCVPN